MRIVAHVGVLDWLRPDGDPAGMRAYAAQLRAAASDLDSAGEGAAGGVDSATFVGPAGDRTRARAARLRSRSHITAGELRDLADEISRRAGDVEASQHEWDRLMHALRLAEQPDTSAGSR